MVANAEVYSATGWAVLSTYSGATCKNFYFAEAIPVNTCHKMGGTGGKVQLVGGMWYYSLYRVVAP